MSSIMNRTIIEDWAWNSTWFLLDWWVETCTLRRITVTIRFLTSVFLTHLQILTFFLQYKTLKSLLELWLEHEKLKWKWRKTRWSGERHIRSYAQQFFVMLCKNNPPMSMQLEMLFYNASFHEVETELFPHWKFNFDPL